MFYAFTSGGTHLRERVCDSPPPSNGGQGCVGEATQSEDCNTDKCVRKLYLLILFRPILFNY